MAWSATPDWSSAGEEASELSSLVADYFISNYPDVGAKSYVGGKERNSKIWTRGVFYEGLLNLYREDPKPEWLKYALDWGEFHKWVSSSDTEAKANNADYQCCGQAYLQLYQMEPDEEKRMEHVKMRIDQTINTGRKDLWTWIDAIQMAMPVFAMLGEITGEDIYHERMWELYEFTRNKQGGSKKGGGEPLFNETTGLWYRDYAFDPPYRDLVELDKDCYWSRGNGWVFMALTRVLQFTSESLSHREDYEADFKRMSEGLLECQKENGSWGVSLHAHTNFGPAGSDEYEMTGTSLIVGGLSWGVRAGLLDSEEYLPAIIQGWETMKMAVHPDGKVGYLQGTGSKPEDGNAITYDNVPDFEDFGYGCWLWGAAEYHALASQLAHMEDAYVSTLESLPDSQKVYYDLQGRKVVNPQPGHFYILRNRLIVY